MLTIKEGGYKFKVGDRVKHKQGSRYYLADVVKIGKRPNCFFIRDLDDGMIWLLDSDDLEVV